MQKSKYEKYSTEELHQKEKRVKTMGGILLGLTVVLLAIVIYQNIVGNFTPITIVPFALLPIILANFGAAKKLRKEIEMRVSK